MFRAVRYEQRFGFRINDTTLADMQSALQACAMATLSGPRIGNELGRIIREPAPLPALRRATELGLLAAVHPAMPTMEHWDRLTSWSSVPPGADPAGRKCPMSWDAALFWTLTADQVASLGMKTSGRTRLVRYVETLKARLPELAAEGLAPSDVCALLDDPALERDPFSMPAALTVALAFAEPLAAERIRRYITEWHHVKPVLDGSDLLRLGVPAGPAVGEALAALRKSRLDGVTNGRKDEGIFALRWVPEATGPSGSNGVSRSND